MKLAVYLLLVCVSVMVCTARAAPAAPEEPEEPIVQDISSTGTGVGEEAFAGSSTYEDQSGRESSGYGSAKKGIATAQSSSYYGGYKIPEELRRAIRARIEARYGPLSMSQNPPNTPTNEATNQAANKATNQAANEATNQAANEATNQAANEATNNPTSE